MYIIEILIKLIKQKNKPLVSSFDDEIEEKCEHIFLAIDSTKDYLACSKCGLVIKNRNKKTKNIFKK